MHRGSTGVVSCKCMFVNVCSDKVVSPGALLEPVLVVWSAGDEAHYCVVLRRPLCLSAWVKHTIKYV